MTYPCRLDLDEYLAFLRAFEVDLVDLDRLALLDGNGGARFLGDFPLL